MTPLTKNIAPFGATPDIRPLFYVRDLTTKLPINARAISNTIPPNPPNPGPNEEWLPIMVEAAPNNDPIFTVSTQSETSNEATLTREIKYKVTQRPLEEKLQAADNARRQQVSIQVPPADFNESLVLIVVALARKQDGFLNTPAEEAALAKLIKWGVALTTNLAASEDQKTAIRAGELPDLTAGFAPKAE